jgi:RNA polymerase sigma-70 factor (ECF subfamily)
MTPQTLTLRATAEPAARAGEAREQRLSQTVTEHLGDVWRFLRRLGLPPADADDAVQDVMLIFSRKLDVVVPGQEKSFLFGTALRVAMRARHARARMLDADDDVLESQEDPGPGPDAIQDERRARELLDHLLDGMPLDLRAVFVLTEVEEMTAAQVAVLLEVAPGTVASRLRRAREMFDTRLARMHARWRFQGGAS